MVAATQGGEMGGAGWQRLVTICSHLEPPCHNLLTPTLQSNSPETLEVLRHYLDGSTLVSAKTYPNREMFRSIKSRSSLKAPRIIRRKP